MDTHSQLDIFTNKEKAIDYAVWINFKYRISYKQFGVVSLQQGKWAVTDRETARNLNLSFVEILPENYSDMTYDHIRHIRMDSELLSHWEKVVGIFSVVDGEILRFLLHSKIPLEKFIRDELAGRGYDEDHRWCGFENAQKIWLQ